jgi:hypothetical protein
MSIDLDPYVIDIYGIQFLQESALGNISDEVFQYFCSPDTIGTGVNKAG